VDGTGSMFANIISYIIKTNGLYEGSYPNMCSDRYVIAEEAARIAAQEGAAAIAHGSSAMGNDQVRFDMALASVAPEARIIAPIRDTSGDRQAQMNYLDEKGFPVDARNKKYSVNQNILGVTFSGSEIDQLEEPDESMFMWTRPTRTDDTRLEIGFESGVPTMLDGEELSGAEILIKLNETVGAFGFGRGFYTGDCIVGIKGHIAFEAPGILALIRAHTALEQIVHTKTQHDLGRLVGEHFTELVYSGRYYDPAVEDIKSYVDAQQRLVSGTVGLRLNPNQVQPVAVASPYSLINHDIASYAQSSSWTPGDAEGFIKLYGMQSRIAAERDRPRGTK